jgi:polysaccharide biosynthesis protein PslH
MLRALAKRHQVTYVCLDDGTAAPDALERAREYAHRVVTVPFRAPPRSSPAFWLDLVRNLASPLPYAIAKYRSRALRSAIVDECRRGEPDVVVCDFLAPSLNVPSDLGVPTVLFQHNVEAMIWERHATTARGALRRAFMGEQWRRMRRFEAAECRRFDHVVAVSPQDADVFRDDYRAPSVSDVPTGVDADYFQPRGDVPHRPRSLVFTGSMDWLPNEDAIQYFVAEVLPLVRARVPNVTLTVVGRNPSAPVRALADGDASIEVTGSVPDVRPYLESASAFIVPIRIGGGTRLKIFEAMSMGLPVVSTTVGAEGLPVRDGTDVVLADASTDFAAALVTLLEDPARARAMGAVAAAAVRERFAWEGIAAAFARDCASVARGQHAAAASADPSLAMP